MWKLIAIIFILLIIVYYASLAFIDGQKDFRKLFVPFYYWFKTLKDNNWQY